MIPCTNRYKCSLCIRSAKKDRPLIGFFNPRRVDSVGPVDTKTNFINCSKIHAPCNLRRRTNATEYLQLQHTEEAFTVFVLKSAPGETFIQPDTVSSAQVIRLGSTELLTPRVLYFNSSNTVWVDNTASCLMLCLVSGTTPIDGERCLY